MSADAIKTVGVLGAGTMGNGIAHAFARSGFRVILRDVEKKFLDRGLETISRNLDREVKKGKITEGDKPIVVARIRPVTDAAELAVRQSRKFPKEQLTQGIVALYEADSRLKSGGTTQREVMEFLVSQLASPAKTTARGAG